MPPRYDGATDPMIFLLAYEEAVLGAGGDDRVMANWLPMALTGIPCAWLLHLPTASVTSWEELRDLFLARFAAPAPPVLTALLGGSQAPPSSHHAKPFAHWISTASRHQEASPRLGAARGRSNLRRRTTPSTPLVRARSRCCAPPPSAR